MVRLSDMLILAADTCNGNMSVALHKKRECLDLIHYSSYSNPAEDLVVTIDQILQKNHITYRDINMLAACTGPGSFTGIRICIATVTAMHMALNKTLATGVRLTEVYARIPTNPQKKDIIVLIPSRNGIFFYEKVDHHCNVKEKCRAAKNEHIKYLLQNVTEPTLLCGILPKDLGAIGNVESCNINHNITASDIALTAYKKYLQNKSDSLEPVYAHLRNTTDPF